VPGWFRLRDWYSVYGAWPVQRTLLFAGRPGPAPVRSCSTEAAAGRRSQHSRWRTRLIMSDEWRLCSVRGRRDDPTLLPGRPTRSPGNPTPVWPLQRAYLGLHTVSSSGRPDAVVTSTTSDRRLHWWHGFLQWISQSINQPRQFLVHSKTDNVVPVSPSAAPN
jgi:hypothetical protein